MELLQARHLGARVDRCLFGEARRGHKRLPPSSVKGGCQPIEEERDGDNWERTWWEREGAANWWDKQGERGEREREGERGKGGEIRTSALGGYSRGRDSAADTCSARIAYRRGK